jgi:hypothetical protein
MEDHKNFYKIYIPLNKSNMRYPAHSGTLYKSTFDELDKEIRQCFESDIGPGDLPASRTNKKILGIIAPNASYEISGPCAAWAFKEIGESEFPDTYIILSEDPEKDLCYLSTEDWETPFGKIKTNKELASVLIKNLDFVKENNDLHRTKHEIEVQLPFLQFVSRDNLHNLTILPCIIGNLSLNQIKELADFLESLERKLCIIVSSNLTLDKEENKLILKALNEMNPEYFLNKIRMRDLLASIEIAKSFGIKTARTLIAYQSKKNSRGYAALVLE